MNHPLNSTDFQKYFDPICSPSCTHIAEWEQLYIQTTFPNDTSYQIRCVTICVKHMYMVHRGQFLCFHSRSGQEFVGRTLYKVSTRIIDLPLIQLQTHCFSMICGNINIVVYHFYRALGESCSRQNSHLDEIYNIHCRFYISKVASSRNSELKYELPTNSTALNESFFARTLFCEQ